MHATDSVLSLTVHSVRNVVRHSDQPVLYYLLNGPGRGFVPEELMVVPYNTELPPDRILIRH